MPAAPAGGEELARTLRTILAAGDVLDGLPERQACSSDLWSAGAVCALVIRPRDCRQLQRAVAAITSAGYGVVPRGGGLTYVGGYTPRDSMTVVVDLAAMNRIIAVDAENMYVTVEAGVTWRQIYLALEPLGLRLPFFGTFSGSRATVGGGLSNGALFFGTARYGSAADIVLSMAVVLADGQLLRTGQAGVTNAPHPSFRNYGPDLTGVFTHDCGVLGIKAEVTLRLIRAPAATDYLSFAFEDAADAVAALSEVGRAEVAEEAYVMDAQKTREALGASAGLLEDAATLRKVVARERTLVRGLVAGARLVAGGRSFVADGASSLHVACAARSVAALAADLAACRKIAASLRGVEIPNSIPKTARADLFPPVNAVLNARGERWIALNAKVAHAQALPLVAAAQALFDANRDSLEREHVSVGCLWTVLSTHSFSFEPVFTWADRWLPMHRVAPEPGYLANLQEPPAAPGAHALVERLRRELVELFDRVGAASSQIGTTYPYLAALRPETRALLRGLKRIVDPEGRMNPGVLGL